MAASSGCAVMELVFEFTDSNLVFTPNGEKTWPPDPKKEEEDDDEDYEVELTVTPPQGEGPTLLERGLGLPSLPGDIL